MFFYAFISSVGEIISLGKMTYIIKNTWDEMMLRRYKLLFLILLLGILLFLSCEKKMEYADALECGLYQSDQNDAYDTLKVIRIPIGTMVHSEMADDADYDSEKISDKKAWDAKEKKLVNGLYAKGAVLMDADSGRVLFGKNADESLAMASTTKIMTCILALEYMNLEDVVSFSNYAVSMPKVKMYGKKDEQFYLQDLLKAMMLESYNDAAVAIAEAVGRKYLTKNDATDYDYVEYFVSMMNQKAVEIGCDNTHFLTPNGLDTPGYSISQCELEKGHVTTAVDLARMMRYCVCMSEKRDEFIKITQVRNHSFYSLQNRHFSAVNRNQLLNQLNGAESGKTGYTSKAGYCYVGSLHKEGKHMIVSLLACGWPSNRNYKWKDSKRLFQYGMENYRAMQISELELENRILSYLDFTLKNMEEVQAAVVQNTKEEKCVENILIGENDELEIYCYCCSKCRNKIGKGDCIGKAIVYVNDMKIGQYDIISLSEIHEEEENHTECEMMEKFLLTC